MAIFTRLGTTGERFWALGILSLVICHHDSVVEDLRHDMGGANDVDHPSTRKIDFCRRT
jgi:hypothetical protein